MRCDLCKKKRATVHLTQQELGKEIKVNLCADCAQKSGVDDPTGLSLADLFARFRKQ